MVSEDNKFPFCHGRLNVDHNGFADINFRTPMFEINIALIKGSRNDTNWLLRPI